MMDDASNTERMRRLILLLENTTPDDDDGYKEIEALDREMRLSDFVRQMRSQGIKVAKRSRTEGSDLVDIYWPAKGTTLSGVPLDWIRIGLMDDHNFYGHSLTVKPVPTDKYINDCEENGTDPWENVWQPNMNDIMHKVIMDVIGPEFGIIGVDFMDWDYDDSPWYGAIVKNGSIIDVLATPENRRRLLAMATP
jgi:hypothetical protein